MGRVRDTAAPRRGRGSRGSGWWGDLALGMRLAVLSGRSPKSVVVRLTLATIGIGLLVAALLLGSALMPALNARADRMADSAPVLHGQPGEPSVTIATDHVRYHGDVIEAIYLQPSGPEAPVPPGLTELPAPGEAVVSPALAESLDSPDGKLLRPRIGAHVAGLIGKEGVDGPADMRFYVGADDLSRVDGARVAYGFGGDRGREVVGPEQLAFVLPATGILVAPLLIFIATTSRVSGAERERRLSALRLVGGSRRQVRRIAATEPMVGLASGGVLGVGIFLLLRQLAVGFSFAGLSVYPSDLSPPWPLILLVAVLVPALTIGASWVGMRGTIAEPLGVVRHSKTAQRNGWWRVLLVLAGVVLMMPDLLGMGTTNTNTAISQSVGAVILLIGVPVLMPWLTERIVSALNGRSPAAQLAIRRLQLDSATPTRVVAGVVVVLAGTVALHTVFGAVQEDLSNASGANDNTVEIGMGELNPQARDGLRDRIARVEGVEELYPMRQYEFFTPDGSHVQMLVAGCALLARSFHVPDCSAGDVFAVRGSDLRAGSRLGEYSYAGGRPVLVDSFALPALEKVERGRAGSPFKRAKVLATSAAARDLPLPRQQQMLHAVLAPDKPGAVERVRNVLAPVHWETGIYAPTSNVQPIGKLKDLLHLGAVFTMLLAAVSLLVAATQQVADRRRALAAMNASGVPTGVLARSLLWQNAIPMSFGVLIAGGVGVGVGWLAMRNLELIFSPDWAFIASITASAVVLVLAVTAATLPSLRSATRLDALRAE